MQGDALPERRLLQSRRSLRLAAVPRPAAHQPTSTHAVDCQPSGPSALPTRSINAITLRGCGCLSNACGLVPLSVVSSFWQRCVSGVQLSCSVEARSPPASSAGRGGPVALLRSWRRHRDHRAEAAAAVPAHAGLRHSQVLLGPWPPPEPRTQNPEPRTQQRAWRRPAQHSVSGGGQLANAAQRVRQESVKGSPTRANFPCRAAPTAAGRSWTRWLRCSCTIPCAWLS